MSSTVYRVPNDIRTYDCPSCNTNVSCLIWKDGGKEFKCENCWEKAPENQSSIYEMIAEKINSILKR